MRRNALILILLITLSVTWLFGQTGAIAGRAKDDTGKSLPYVNVSILKDSKRITGMQATEKGTYKIINIPPGLYDVKFQLMGYRDYTVTDVRVNQGTTTTTNATMVKKGFELDPIRVSAPNVRVNPNETSSTRKINMTETGEMAVDDIEGIIALQAGASVVGGELHIRGGRAQEVNYSIDGMSVSDPVDGGSALQVDTDAISDMKIMTGGFTAEYGNAQSGQVAIVTKEGDSKYSGKLEWSTDRYIGQTRNEDAIKFAIGGPVIPFGNPDLKDKFTFYLNGGGDWLDGRLRKYASGDPNDDFVYVDDSTGVSIPLLENDYPEVNPFASRKKIFKDGFLDFIPDVEVGNRFYNSYNVNMKTKYAFSETQKVTFAARGDRSVNDFFSYSWRYAPEFNGADETVQRQYVASYDYVISPAMNLKVKASYFQKNYSQAPKGIDTKNYFFYSLPAGYTVPRPDSLPDNYTEEALNGEWGYGYESVGNSNDGTTFYYDSPEFLDPTFWLYRVQGQEDPRPVGGFVAPGRINDNLVTDQTASTQFKADFEWQVNDTHQAKSGLEIVRHSIKKDQVFNFLYRDRKRWTDYLNTVYNIDNYVDPDTTDGVVYIPEELADVVITDEGTAIPIYFPYDYYNAAYAASGRTDGYKAAPWSGAYYLQDKMEWEGMIVNAGLRFDFWYLGSDYQIALDGGGYRTSKIAGSDKFRVNISPRLGVSHPISDRDVLRFAYNYQNQLPQMQFIFTSKDSLDAITNPGTTVGNPDLEPQISVTYEVGLTHQLSEDYVIDMTAYYKNLYNYVSTRKVQASEATVFWYEFISEDYGSSRGIDMQLEKSLSDFNSWSIAYSLAWAQGNNSATVIQDEATNLREFPLDWDIRHNVNLNYTFRIGRGEEFIIPYTNLVLPLDDFSANMTWSLSTGTPYTPTSGPQNTALDTNSKRKDLTQQANMRLTKGIVLPGGSSMRLYMDVENLFKYPNVGGVFSKTGSPYYDGNDISEDVGGGVNFTFPEVEYMYNKAIINPGNVNSFRAVTLGVSFNF